MSIRKVFAGVLLGLLLFAAAWNSFAQEAARP